MTARSKRKALERLNKARMAIPSLKGLHRESPEFPRWFRNTRVAIEHTFGSDSQHVKEFNGIQFVPIMFTSSTPDSFFQQRYVDGLGVADSLLRSMIEEVGEYWEDDTPRNGSAEQREPRTLAVLDRTESSSPVTPEVFVVHGRNTDAKDAVARFLEHADLDPVVLSERPGRGRTIIEKFEEHSSVGFAVVLMTPDDAGGLKDASAETEPRARQNVIFELGFFIGRLGRGQVCALVKGEIEIPSNYSGVEYIDFDERGEWKRKLTQELRSAGFEIDANRALRT